MSRKTKTVLSKRGTRALDAVADYLYGEAQNARSRDEHDAWSLTLAVLGAVRRGNPQPFLAACYTAFGTTLERYQARRNKEKWVQAQGIAAWVPDYDPQEALRATKEQARAGVVDFTTGARVESETARAPARLRSDNGRLPGARRTLPDRKDATALRSRA